MGVVVSNLSLIDNHVYLLKGLTRISVRESSHPYCEVNGWTFNTTANWNERKAAYRLRAQVFDDELQWSHSNDGYEVDILDEFATHLVVKDPKGNIAATARTLDWDAPWMATECYASRFADEAASVRHRGVHEVSRLCIASSYRYKEIAPSITVFDVFLYGMLAFGLSNGKSFSYFVTRGGMERAMRNRGFEITHRSARHRMPDGCVIRSFLVANQQSYDQFDVTR